MTNTERAAEARLPAVTEDLLSDWPRFKRSIAMWDWAIKYNERQDGLAWAVAASLSLDGRSIEALP